MALFDLTTIVGNLQRLGFYDFVLPWLLFFAVILGILKKGDFIGDNKINSIIAAVIAFFIVNFTPVGGISAYYSTLFGVGGMVIGVLLVLVLLGGALGYKPKELIEGGDKEQKKWAYPLVGLVLVIFAFLAFTQATGGSIAGIGISNDTLTLIFVLVFILLVIGYASGGGGATTAAKPEKLE